MRATKKMTTQLKSAYFFFKANAGYCVGRKAQGALALAKAEQAAKDAGCTYKWQDDSDCDWSFVETWAQKDQDAFAKQEHFAEICSLLSADGETLDVLCGITDANRSYRRVIEAELALNSLDSMLSYSI